MKIPERKPEEPKGDALQKELDQEKAALKKQKFVKHIAKSYLDGKLQVKDGIGGIVEEYKSFSEQKDASMRKYLAYETVVSGAKDSTEYYILLVLSCLIATFGLYQNSPATIIGAMIVAPFMGPIFAFSAGVLWGSGKAVRTSAMTILKGLGIVIALTALLTLVVPNVTLTNELLARSKPTLFDIAVAVACGLIGAYSFVNNKIVAAIPGVAISVALMPPACTIGIGLGMGNWQLAGGAALLFGVNLFGIMLAGMLVFYFVKLHPLTEKEEELQKIKRRAAGGILTTTLMLALISLPLVYFMVITVQDNSNRNTIRSIIQQYIPGEKIYSLEITKPNSVGISSPKAYDVEAILLADQASPATNAGSIQDRLTTELKLPVTLKLYSIGAVQNP